MPSRVPSVCRRCGSGRNDAACGASGTASSPSASIAVSTAHRLPRLCRPGSGSDVVSMTKTSPRCSASPRRCQPSARPNQRTSLSGKRQRGQRRIIGVEHRDARPGIDQQAQLVLDVARLASRASRGVPETRSARPRPAGARRWRRHRRSGSWTARSPSTSGAWAGSSSSSNGRPMLPASAVTWPPARSRCASSAVLVLLPLVPVTQTVRAAVACSANHSAVPPMKRVPCSAAAKASARYGLIPGDFTTTSKADNRAAVASVSTVSCGSPSACASAASSVEQNSVSGKSRQARTDRAHRPRGLRGPSPTARPGGLQAAGCMQRAAHATGPRASAECAARRRAPAAARSRKSAGIELRPDLAREALDQRVLAPFRARGQRRHRRARFAAFADAFERLVVLEFEQRVVAGGLRRIVEQVAAEDADQPRLRHERRQREEHEMALRAHAAPAVGGTLAEDVEVAVAAGEVRVVAVDPGELARDRQLAQRAQQRVVLQVGGDMALHVVAEGRLARPALRPLVVHLAGDASSVR